MATASLFILLQGETEMKKNWRLPTICLSIVLKLGYNLPILLSANAATHQANRNPVEQQVIIYNDCKKCHSEEGGSICCPQ